MNKLDLYIEKLFGKPDYSNAFIKDDLLYIPMTKNNRLFKIEEIIKGKNEILF